MIKRGTVLFYLVVMILAVLLYNYMNVYMSQKNNEGFCAPCLAALLL